MRAARYHRYGPPDVIALEEVPAPSAPEGAVRVRVQATSVNPIDWLLRSGRLAEAVDLPLPAIPGRDAAGVVDQVGAGVEGTRVGDVVFGLGGLADTTAAHAVLTAWAPVPQPWSMPEAAAAGLAAATAVRGLDTLADALGDLAGRTLLVEGAAGSVGSAAVAVARSRGIRVVGTASPAHQQLLADAGALATTYGPGLPGRLAELCPDGVDAALDTAGAGTLGTLVEVVGDPAGVATVADAAGAGEHGVALVFAENDSALLQTAADLGARGDYRPRVARVLPLDDVVRAHELVERGGAGKVVLTLP
ncbi:NADP-dependent oxidoreductase [Pseudokineococcus sp. 1T1Z-3]|uniref:NADP-dependent oxidoreductase n=1 Tax=Pseudokineococcus sp. 1T1Z-3 TaxID=3132745 RepID=UPI0030B42041